MLIDWREQIHTAGDMRSHSGSMDGNTAMTSGPTIDYEALQQEAMRGVVRSVLKATERNGLPGEHHFYISFDTRAPGVVISRRLKEKYQQEMTIVLQHRFWGLVVTDERFEVNLTFDGIPERLVVPFQAIRVFVDPSVRYGLQFEAADIGPDPATISLEDVAAKASAANPKHQAESQTERTLPPRKRTSTKRSNKGAERPPKDAEATQDKTPPPLEQADADQEEAAEAVGGGTNVVDLDAFRKR
jgi:hypothetical protein